jgi:hypothetical protein
MSKNDFAAAGPTRRQGDRGLPQTSPSAPASSSRAQAHSPARNGRTRRWTPSPFHVKHGPKRSGPEQRLVFGVGPHSASLLLILGALRRSRHRRSPPVGWITHGGSWPSANLADPTSAKRKTDRRTFSAMESDERSSPTTIGSPAVSRRAEIDLPPIAGVLGQVSRQEFGRCQLPEVAQATAMQSQSTKRTAHPDEPALIGPRAKLWNGAVAKDLQPHVADAGCRPNVDLRGRPPQGLLVLGPMIAPGAGQAEPPSYKATARGGLHRLERALVTPPKPRGLRGCPGLTGGALTCAVLEPNCAGSGSGRSSFWSMADLSGSGSAALGGVTTAARGRRQSGHESPRSSDRWAGVVTSPIPFGRGRCRGSSRESPPKGALLAGSTAEPRRVATEPSHGILARSEPPGVDIQLAPRPASSEKHMGRFNLPSLRLSVSPSLRLPPPASRLPPPASRLPPPASRLPPPASRLRGCDTGEAPVPTQS